VVFPVTNCGTEDKIGTYSAGSRKKIGDGPYCLGCFRSATIKGGRSGWISGMEAIEKGLVE